MNALIVAFWLMLPAYIPNNCAALFGAARLWTGDGFCRTESASWRWQDLSGNICRNALRPPGGLLQNQIAPVLGLPSFGSGFEQFFILLSLSLGAMLGDIVAAFFKRRMGLQRGAPLFIIDQLDFVLGAWLMSLLVAPEWFMQHFTFTIVLVVLIITPILHRVTNIIGYRMGRKEGALVIWLWP